MERKSYDLAGMGKCTDWCFKAEVERDSGILGGLDHRSMDRNNDKYGYSIRMLSTEYNCSYWLV